MKITKPKISNLISTDDLKLVESKKHFDTEYKDINFKGNFSYLAFDGCIFENVNFEKLETSKIEFVDCIFKNCNLSNFNLSKVILRRTQFIETSLMGVDLSESSMRDVLFLKTSLKYSSFSFAELSKVIFQESLLDDCFFNAVKISKSIFDKCDLSNVDFLNTSLKDIDISTSNLNCLRITHKELVGAVISDFQTSFICETLGIKISEDDNND